MRVLSLCTETKKTKEGKKSHLRRCAPNEQNYHEHGKLFVCLKNPLENQLFLFKARSHRNREILAIPLKKLAYGLTEMSHSPTKLQR